jgi:hypothetical protein
LPKATQLPVAAAATQAPEVTQAIAALPEQDVVQYLLTQADRLTLQDLAETPVADQDLTAAFLPGSAAELEEALDEQPSVDVYL